MEARKADNSDGLPGEEASSKKGTARYFPCESCGADLEFSIGQQSLVCPYCGHEKALSLDEDARVEEQDLLATLETLRNRRMEGARQRGSGEEAVKELRCEDCGANVRFVGTLTSQHCAYCGSPIQVEGAHEAAEGIPVDGVLPFQIEERGAKEGLKAWLKSRWFLPNDLKKSGIESKFNAVYLPYWTFDAMTANRYRGERGEHYWVTVGSGKNRKQVRKTRWYPASGRFQRFFDDVLVVASRGLPEKIIDRLEPWPLESVIPWNPEALAGKFSRTYDIELDRGFGTGKSKIEREIERDVRSRIGGDVQRVHSIDTNYGALRYKQLLLPLYLLAYRYRKKSYQIVVNAATGEVQGQRPWSIIKIALLALLIIVIVGGIWYLTRQ